MYIVKNVDSTLIVYLVFQQLSYHSGARVCQLHNTILIVNSNFQRSASRPMRDGSTIRLSRRDEQWDDCTVSSIHRLILELMLEHQRNEPLKCREEQRLGTHGRLAQDWFDSIHIRYENILPLWCCTCDAPV
jgi:hypothetical protein